MESIIEKLFYTYISEERLSIYSIKEMTMEIEAIKKRLKENLSNEQKKLLLRIEDKKDLINEISNSECFITGFKMGLKVGLEVNKN